MKGPQITIAIQSDRFERRLCWMLSSLAQQSALDRIRVDIAHVRRDGPFTTCKVIHFFRDYLNIGESVWPDLSRFQYRGFVRNLQLKECSTEWLMFGDTDMVYEPSYFEKLLDYLENHHARAPYMLSSGRVSNPKEKTEALVTEYIKDRPMLVAGAWRIADMLPKIRRGNVGAGFCQLINVLHCPHGGYYVAENENRDWSWSKRGSNPKSDMQFRKRIAKTAGPRQPLPEWFSTHAIHLNHDRDPEFGKHLETQR